MGLPGRCSRRLNFASNVHLMKTGDRRSTKDRRYRGSLDAAAASAACGKPPRAVDNLWTAGKGPCG